MNFEKPQSTPPETTPKLEKKNHEQAQIGALADFDMKYFQQLVANGEDDWIALGHDEYKNQRYFTVKDINGENLGFVGMYDTDTEKNITHTFVDQKYRGQGLALEFKTKLLDALNEDYYIATVNLNNSKSLSSMENLLKKNSGLKIVSDEAYEQEFHKRKYRFDRPKEDKK